ncbi:MAG TPA: DUF4259 domain-containing protein [Opitutaceae bacterium]|jgi:hypothetical protein|nr:DUF4259 domain-containing protein [Opitutaceae bacterium]
MGAWANDPFGNDTAGDWADGLDKTEDLSLIEETIQRVLGMGDNYLEAPEAEEAIAAADTLARLRGKYYVRNAYTKSVDKWVEKHRLTPSPELVASAIRAIDRILTKPSELLDLWSEGADSDTEEWKQQMVALKERLR